MLLNFFIGILNFLWVKWVLLKQDFFHIFNYIAKGVDNLSILKLKI